MAPKRPILSVILPPRMILKTKLPHRSTEPFSVINKTHMVEIAPWIDRNADTYFMSNILYEFKLLFRGRRDGFTKNTFWNLCNKQTHLVVVMKVKGTDERQI
ncbi:hypothetical protein C2G38_2190136 [Gigaspora rosea]|uniref:TLDc domain-containing protein n=1 Tax=Gigaspora rosea TaxID=44941 RepID=A0A397V1I2_9GLOM|nr:hypothetical protein C2G38_2190136 [Gigaspora rosea]